MIDVGGAIDSSFLTRALKIAANQTNGFGSLIILILSARILFALAFSNNISSYFDSLKHFFMCSLLLFCFDDIIGLLHSMPELIAGESKGALKVAISNDEVIDGYNYFMNLALIATYWICIIAYYLAMFLLICIGPIIILFSFLTVSFGILKSYFSILVIINIWPLCWHLVNVFSTSVVGSFEVLQNGFMSGIILFFSSIIKLLIPLFLYIFNKPIGFLMLTSVQRILSKGSKFKKSTKVRILSLKSSSMLEAGIEKHQSLNDFLYGNRLRSTPFSSHYLFEKARKEQEEAQQMAKKQEKERRISMARDELIRNIDPDISRRRWKK